MRSLLVFGTGDFSDVISYILEEKLNLKIQAYVLNASYCTEDEYRGKPLLPLETIEDHVNPAECDMVMGFIGKQMMQQKALQFETVRSMGFGMPNIIDPSSSVDTQQLGEGNIILANVAIEAHCVVGSGNLIWQNVVLPHHNQVGSFNNLAPSVSFSGYSKVGNHCFIGNNVALNNRIEVGDYSYIGAGSYVNRSLPEGTVYVPSRGQVLADKSGFDFL